MRDAASTRKANHVFGYPLLLINIFYHFNADLSSEQWENTDVSNIILSLTISRSSFEYDEKEMAEECERGSKRETFGYERTRRVHPTKEVTKEEDDEEDYEAEDSEEEDEEYDASF